jgi:hypothetical protein
VPIKPENKARYPKDWKDLRRRVLERARNRCERCYVPNHAYRNRVTGEVTKNPLQAESWELVDGQKCTFIVLTIAHVDQTPEHNDMENLRAWCQKCHLAHDHVQHQRSAYASRRRGKASAELF